jgi:glutathione S-transferase
MDLLTYVDLDTARAAPGVRMVVARALPSPWSEAAKGLFRVKEVPALVVAGRPGPELEAWTRVDNVPVVFFDAEAPRSHWAAIVTRAERLGGRVALVPKDPETRASMFGLLHEVAGEDGLGWSSRLIMIDGGLRSDGREGFPLEVATRLAPKYGYAPERIAPARARIAEVLAQLDRRLADARAAGHRYLLGDAPTALDIYVATFLTPITGVTEAECPQMRAPVRPAFAYLGRAVGDLLSAEVAAYRRFMFDEHLGWPIVLDREPG